MRLQNLNKKLISLGIFLNFLIFIFQIYIFFSVKNEQKSILSYQISKLDSSRIHYKQFIDSITQYSISASQLNSIINFIERKGVKNHLLMHRISFIDPERLQKIYLANGTYYLQPIYIAFEGKYKNMLQFLRDLYQSPYSIAPGNHYEITGKPGSREIISGEFVYHVFVKGNNK